MDSLKKIMYGVTDFPLMWRENAYFVDRTALIELKYLKAEEKVTRQKLVALRKEAARQLDQYAADRDLARLWRLAPQGTVKLTRLAIVFHGTELALCEELPGCAKPSLAERVG